VKLASELQRRLGGVGPARTIYVLGRADHRTALRGISAAARGAELSLVDSAGNTVVVNRATIWT